jgi:hypothetical protein
VVYFDLGILGSRDFDFAALKVSTHRCGVSGRKLSLRPEGTFRNSRAYGKILMYHGTANCYRDIRMIREAVRRALGQLRGGAGSDVVG